MGATFLQYCKENWLRVIMDRTVTDCVESHCVLTAGEQTTPIISPKTEVTQVAVSEFVKNNSLSVNRL